MADLKKEEQALRAKGAARVSSGGGSGRGRTARRVHQARQLERARKAAIARRNEAVRRGAPVPRRPLPPKPSEVAAGGAAATAEMARRQKAEALMRRLKAQPRRTGTPIKAAAVSPLRRLISRVDIPFVTRTVSDRDLMVFTRQFATMINAGLPLVQSLAIQCLQVPNPLFREQLTVVKERVQSGSTLAGALKKFPKTFDPLYVNLIAAGEMGGVLDEILLRLAVHIEKSSQLKRQVKAALVYPAAIVTVAISVLILLLLKVVPVFQRMFLGVGTEIPAPTQAIIDLSYFVKTNFLGISVVILGLIVLFIAFYNISFGRTLIDRMMLKAPVLGDIVTKIEVARFARTLNTMLASGVSIIDALEVSARAATNIHVRRAIASAMKGVTEGKMLGRRLAGSKIIPGLVCQMITVGEATGALDTMLAKLADFYEGEVETAVGALVSLIEPALMIFLGLVVGGLLIAMYMPIFIMAGAVGGV